MFHPLLRIFECDSCGAIVTTDPAKRLRDEWFRAWDNGWRAGPGPQAHGCPSCEAPPPLPPLPKPKGKSFLEILNEVLFEDQRSSRCQQSPR
jgi:hypothetical protein